MKLNKRIGRVARFRNWIAVRVIGLVYKVDEPISVDRRCTR